MIHTIHFKTSYYAVKHNSHLVFSMFFSFHAVVGPSPHPHHRYQLIIIGKSYELEQNALLTHTQKSIRNEE